MIRGVIVVLVLVRVIDPSFRSTRMAADTVDYEHEKLGALSRIWVYGSLTLPLANGCGAHGFVTNVNTPGRSIEFATAVGKNADHKRHPEAMREA